MRFVVYEEDCLSTEAGPAVETGVRGPPPGSRTRVVLQVVPQVVFPRENLTTQTTPKDRLGEAGTASGVFVCLPALLVPEREVEGGR